MKINQPLEIVRYMKFKTIACFYFSNEVVHSTIWTFLHTLAAHYMLLVSCIEYVPFSSASPHSRIVYYMDSCNMISVASAAFNYTFIH